MEIKLYIEGALMVGEAAHFVRGFLKRQPEDPFLLEGAVEPYKSKDKLSLS